MGRDYPNTREACQDMAEFTGPLRLTRRFKLVLFKRETRKAVSRFRTEWRHAVPDSAVVHRMCCTPGGFSLKGRYRDGNDNDYAAGPPP